MVSGGDDVEAIIAAIITGLLTAGAAIYGSKAANDKTVAVLEERMASMREDIQRLERKQEESNRIKERLAIVERDVKTAWGRIDELREMR